MGGAKRNPSPFAQSMGIASLHPSYGRAILAPALDHAEPAKPPIRLVARRGVERDQRAGTVLVEAERRPSRGSETRSVSRPWPSDAAITRKFESTSSTRALSAAPTRTPWTMARACGSQSKWIASTPVGLAGGLAAGANAGAIGHDLGIAEQGLAFDVADGVFVAGAQAPCRAKPFCVRHVLADDVESGRRGRWRAHCRRDRTARDRDRRCRRRGSRPAVPRTCAPRRQPPALAAQSTTAESVAHQRTSQVRS